MVLKGNIHARKALEIPEAGPDAGPRPGSAGRRQAIDRT
jgi:hypothetical protein